MSTSGTAVHTIPVDKHKHATLLERLQCLGMLGEIVADAARAGDAKTEVDALSNCLLVNSARLTPRHVSTLQAKCRELGKTWAPLPLSAFAMPAVLWQHVDGFLAHVDSFRLMATCRYMAAATLGPHPCAEAVALDAARLVRDMRAAPSRFLNIGRLEFSDVEPGPGASRPEQEWDLLAAHVRDTIGPGGLNVHRLVAALDAEDWLLLIRVCPGTRTIVVMRTDELWMPSDLTALLAEAGMCTAVVAWNDFCVALGQQLIVPARVTSVHIEKRVLEGIVFEDPSRVISLELPGYHRFGDLKQMHPFAGLRRLMRPQPMSAALIGPLPCLLELSICSFPLDDRSWIPDSLQRLDMVNCRIGHLGLAHCLRPESRLAVIRCNRCTLATDGAGDTIVRAFEIVAAAGKVAPGLRELTLPFMPLEIVVGAATDDAQADVQTDAQAEMPVETPVETPDGWCDAAGFVGFVTPGNGHVGLLGRGAHACLAPHQVHRAPSRRTVVVPRGLMLLLRSNVCVVGLGVTLDFQSACSKSCVHATATEHRF